MAFLQPTERQPFLRVPVAASALIGALVLAHVARILAPPELQLEILDNYAFQPERYSPAFVQAHNIAPQSFWDLSVPFLSYIFLHANFTHLLINCVWLLPFGTLAARRFGVIGFYLLFFLSGIAAALAHLVVFWGMPVPIVGASGAIAGTMGASFRVVTADSLSPAAMRLMALGHVTRARLAPLYSPRLLQWTLIVVILFVLAGRFGIGGGPTPSGPIAWQAHIGGYLAGLLLASPIERLHRWLEPHAPSLPRDPIA